MADGIDETYVSDSEFYEYIRYNQVENFKARINSGYISSLRFTNYGWSCLQLAIHYGRVEIMNNILEADSTQKFVCKRDYVRVY